MQYGRYMEQNAIVRAEGDCTCFLHVILDNWQVISWYGEFTPHTVTFEGESICRGNHIYGNRPVCYILRILSCFVTWFGRCLHVRKIVCSFPEIPCPQIHQPLYCFRLLLLLLFYSPLLGLGRFFSFLILYTVDRTPWMWDQPVARPLTYTQNNTNTE
jgi:hypothetical protein